MSSFNTAPPEKSPGANKNASPLGYMSAREKSVNIAMPKRPPPSPVKIPAPSSPPKPSSFSFTELSVDDIFAQVSEELNDLKVPNAFGFASPTEPKEIPFDDPEEYVVSTGLQPNPADKSFNESSTTTTENSSDVSDKSRANSQVSENSLVDTHGSNNSYSPRSFKGDISPRKYTVINKTLEKVGAANPPRSSSDSELPQKQVDIANARRLNSEPTQRAPLKPHPPVMRPISVQTPIVVTDHGGPSSAPNSPLFGMESYTSMTDSLNSMNNSLTQSTGSLTNTSNSALSTGSSPKVATKKILRVVDDLILVSKNFVTMLKGGTLDKIIDYLVKQPSRDTDSTNAFLLNYRKYIEPSQLLGILFTKLNNALTDEQAINDQIVLRCINLIQYWVSSHYHDFADDPELLSELKERLALLGDDKLVNPIRSTINRQDIKYRSILAKPPMQIVNPSAKKVNLLDFKPALIAQQLCLFEHELFRAIHPKEFLNQNWNKHKEKAPNIIRLVNWFNTIAAWIESQILQCSSSKDREKMTKLWIKVADFCRLNNNFNAVQEVMSAFSNNALHRLKNTLWAKIHKSKTASETLQNLRNLVDTTKSCKNYREALKGAVGSCIPFMGQILTDLVYIEDGNPNILNVEGRTDIINFEKAMRISAIIGHHSPSILAFQLDPYKFPVVESVYSIFSSGLCPLSEDLMYQLSYKIEPRKAK